MTKNVLIIGATDRDFHNFNTFYHSNKSYNVAAFTAEQFPNIDRRNYQAKLAENLYPNGIPIYAEEELEKLIFDLKIDDCVFSYNDVPNARVMTMSTQVNDAVANFIRGNVIYAGVDYNLQEIGQPDLVGIVDDFIKKYKLK